MSSREITLHTFEPMVDSLTVVTGLPEAGMRTLYERLALHDGASGIDLVQIAYADNLDQNKRLLDACFEKVPRSVRRLVVYDSGAPEAVFSYVERTHLVGGITSGQTVLLKEGSDTIRLRAYEVRSRVMNSQKRLVPFNLDSTRQYLTDRPEQADILYELTRGYPVLLDLALAALGADTTSSVTEAADAVKTYIEQQVFQKLAANTPRNVIDPILEQIATYREFDINTIRYFTKKKFSDSQLLLMIKGMNASGYVEWSEQTRTYTSDMLRIYDRTLREVDKDKWTEQHSQARSYYGNMLQTVHGDKHIIMSEWLYHSAMIQAPHIVDEAKSIIRNNYASPDGSYVDTRGLENLRQTLARDEELKNCLPDEVKLDSLLHLTV